MENSDAENDDLGNGSDTARLAILLAHAAHGERGPEDDIERDDQWTSRLGSSGEQFEFNNARSRKFSKSSVRDDHVEAEFENQAARGGLAGKGSSAARKKSYGPNGPDILDQYLDQIDLWESGREFVNDANRVENVREKRLELAREIEKNPAQIASEKLIDVRDYLKSDLSYLSRSDENSEDYSEFIQRRSVLRDRMFHGELVVSPEDYVKVAKRAQGMIKTGKYLDDQYEMLDLRREASLEHFNDPRFIVEVAKHPDGFLDELLVDFDRRDLLVENKTTSARTSALAGVFSDAAMKASLPTSAQAALAGETQSHPVEKFRNLRETGMAIRHNQGAIVEFAENSDTATPQGRRAYDIGMSALDNDKFSKSLWEDYSATLGDEDKKFIIENKGPSATFVKVRERFERELAAGDPNVGKSYAILEHAAAKIHASPRLQARLSEIGGVEDLAALSVFHEDREKSARTTVLAGVDTSVVSRMGKQAIQEGLRAGGVSRPDDSGKDYSLLVGPETMFEAVDGAHVRIANNQADLESGKGVVLRLDGIVAPPVGTSSRSGKTDAGAECRQNLEEVMKRHGIKSVGIDIKRLESGEDVVMLRTMDGEDVSQRMIRDGYAIPTRDSEHAARREGLAKQSESNRRGVWAEGFPPMDQSWRREKNSPDLTWKDRRQNIVKNTNDALCTTNFDVQRNLSRPETKLFSLPLKTWAGSAGIDREIARVADRNPTRVSDIYESNMEVLNDLRKRKDKLTPQEKVAHDMLSMGRRALGETLVNKNLLDPEKFMKDSHPMLSQSGIRISMEGIRAIRSAAADGAVWAGQKVAEGAKQTKRGASWLLDEAMS